MSEPLIAKTHPREYMLHKYWARKPHNILAHYIGDYFNQGQLVIDPFCGSGVFLAEAKKVGLNVIGIDINPIASLLTEVTVNPPRQSSIFDEIDGLLKKVKELSKSYRLEDDTNIRYLVHSVITLCPKCKKECSSSSTKKMGNKYLCPNCGERVYFNFNSFSHTKITEIVTDKGIINRTKKTERFFLEQEKLSNMRLSNIKDFDKPVIINRRILAFPDMKSSDLFTERNFSIASILFSEAHAIKDRDIRNAVLLFLTSNLAQISRLIPYRNGLSTGGQAWTVPGFWIAPIHIEANPINHLTARAKKYLNGISDLKKAYSLNTKTTSKVYNDDMTNIMRDIPDKSVDGIFFDPPYGDSIPYLEFSFIWNVFLNKTINYKDEVVVSDRSQHTSKWSDYEERLDKSIKLMSEKLKDNGKIIMTFNNLDPRAWKAILRAYKSHGLSCIKADYQIPAVVSSKAQFAIETSYVGDFYCVFIKKNNKQNKNGNELLLTTLIPIFVQRDGVVPKNIIHRAAILTILQENLDVDLVDSIQDVVHGIATVESSNYVLRPDLQNKYLKISDSENLRSKITYIARRKLTSGKVSSKDFYISIIEELDDSSIPSMNELKGFLDGIVLFEDGYCYLQDVSKIPQLSFSFK